MPKPTPTTPLWFKVLEAARELSPREAQHFSAIDLAAQAGIRDTLDDKGKVISKGSQIASAWISKFIRWGYVDFVEKVGDSSGRSTNSYTITKVGRSCVPTESRDSKIDRLAEAVRAFEKARRTPKEEAAFATMIRVCDEVEG